MPFAIVVAFGKENAVAVGPWSVFSEVVSTDADDDEEEILLNQKAVSSMGDLFDGRISYYLKTPTMDDGDSELPWPLVFVSEFTRETRPRAWKKTDLKLQSTLPLLGTDVTAEELTDGAHQLLVRVSLVLKGESVESSE